MAKSLYKQERSQRPRVISAPPKSNPQDRDTEVLDEVPRAIPYPEYALRILFEAFLPAARIGVEFHYPLDTIREMMTLALWQEAKKKHRTINLISLVFGKSTRTLKTLSSQYNQGRFFERTEQNLLRQVEDLLLRQPMSIGELAERLPSQSEFDSAQLAVNMLLKSGRIEKLPRTAGAVQRYQSTQRCMSTYSSVDWELRLDALREHLEAVGETVRSRFLDRDRRRSLARTFTFRARPAEIKALQEEVLDFIRIRVQELEAEALKQEGDHGPKEREFAALSDFEIFSLYLGLAPQRKKEQ